MSQIPSPTAPQAGNVKLVIVAVVLAVIAVVLVNVYIALDRRGRTDKHITIYRLNQGVRSGEKFNSATDVSAELLPEKYHDAFGPGIIVGDVELKNRDGQRYLRHAPQNTVLTLSLFTESGDMPTLPVPGTGMRQIPITVNSRKAPGILRPGSIVDIEAPFNVGGRIPLVLPVMEQVKVWAVGRQALGDTTGRASRSYRTITIEIEPINATYMSMIEKLAVGEFELHLRDPADKTYPKTGGPGVNPRVIDLVEKALGRPLPQR